MCKKLTFLTSFVLVLGRVFGLAGSAQAKDVVITFSDLTEQGEVEIASDYQPPELEGTGITTTWTGMSQFNDDITGEGLRDHTETWDLGVASVYVYTSDDGGSIEFSSEVEVSSIWIFQDSWAATAVSGYLGGQEIWSVPANHPEQWVEITAGAGHKIDEIVLAGGYSRIDDITIGVGQAEIMTFSDLDEEGEAEIAEDYQPPELEGTGITTTWTGMSQFNDDITGEGLRDHTETRNPAVTSVYIFTGDDGGTIGFSSEVEVPSIWIFQDSWASTAVSGYLGDQEIWSVPANHPEQWVEITDGAGKKIDSIVLVGGYSRIDDITINIGDTYIATDPSPANEVTDVRLDIVVLSWTPGEFTNTHDVYFGNNLDDVRNATKNSPEYKTTKSLGDENYDPGSLELGTTYYWRIDEVNAPPQQSTVFRGEVWQFTTEPVGYPIANVTATASSFSAGQIPKNTIDGTGLDANDLHSNESVSMWLSEAGDAGSTWIKYEFDRIYKLYQMLVWNYNVELEDVVGYGFNEVTIEYSTDGSNWTELEGVPPFAKAPGTDGYACNTTVNFNGVLAKSVRLTANSNHGPFDKYGLSEVRFLYVPGWAREPDPQNSATGVHPDAILSWRPGREAAMHDVYLSTDKQAVMDGTVAAVTVAEASYNADTLELGETYHWRIDEINASEIPAVWEGDTWSFTTADYLVLDNFESYNGLDPDDPQSNRIFMTWKDGAGYGTPDNPPYFAGNGTGSLIGKDTPPFVEEAIVHDGSQSMPYYYDNSGLSGKANYSEVSVDISDLAVGSDWTRAGIKTLTLYFYGDPANSTGEQMYVKINGLEVPYDGASGNITQRIWQPWNIDLTTLVGANLQNVTELTIGFKNGGGSGVVYFDDIRLKPAAQIPDTKAPDDSALVAHWDFEGDFTDATGKGHDGLAFGDPAIINDPLRGQVLEVDGDDRIGISDAADLNFGVNESMTLTVWVNFDLVSAPEGWRAIMAKGRTELGGGTDYVDELYGFWVSPSYNWHVDAGGINADTQAVDGGQWHHLAFVQDGPADAGYFYIDGQVVMSGGADSCDTTGRPLFIGAAGTDVDVAPFESFIGRMDDVRIYSYALSELEIQYLALE